MSPEEIRKLLDKTKLPGGVHLHQPHMPHFPPLQPLKLLQFPPSQPSLVTQMINNLVNLYQVDFDLYKVVAALGQGS